MRVSKTILKMYEHFEGYEKYAYKCPAGVWTIGIGSTLNPNGHKVTATTPPIDYDTAVKWKMAHIERRTIPDIERLMRGVNLNQLEIDAISSLVYNCGEGCLSYKWAVALREYQSAPTGRKLYSKAITKRIVDSWMSICKDSKGNVLPGLLRRRMTEIIYFFNGELVYYANGSYDADRKSKNYAKDCGLKVYQKLGLL